MTPSPYRAIAVVRARRSGWGTESSSRLVVGVSKLAHFLRIHLIVRQSAHNRAIEAHRRPLQGRTIALQVLSRGEAKRLVPDVPYLVISIANTGLPHTTLVDSPHLRGVLRLAFDDVEAGKKGDRGGRTPMTPVHAREIRTFLEENLADVDLIVVHCEAGVSRSPAIAAALWRWREGTRGPFFDLYRPNPHVYRTLMEELG